MCFSFGGKVRKWTTFNEPWVVCNLQVRVTHSHTLLNSGPGSSCAGSRHAWLCVTCEVAGSFVRTTAAEPHTSSLSPDCLLQYGNGDFAPGIKYGESGKWKCGHNLLLSHAKAVKVFRDGYKAKHDGRIGMALWSEWSEPWRPDNEGGVCGVARAWW